MGEGACPNCGHHLVGYRTDRQVAGDREVILAWAICVNCRHVGLTGWRYGDEVVSERKSYPDSRQDRQSQEHPQVVLRPFPRRH